MHRVFGLLVVAMMGCEGVATNNDAAVPLDAGSTDADAGLLGDAGADAGLISDAGLIIDAGTVVESLIGRNVRIRECNSLPKGTRLIVGDNSDISL